MTASIEGPVTLRTPRLLLRPWRTSDYSAFVEIDSDPRICEFYPHHHDRLESAALAERHHARLARDGFGFWAVEVPGEADFIGFIGLQSVPFEAHFTPAMEIGWELAYEMWGRGLATEGARAALAFGHDILELDEIVAMTNIYNARSRRVMEKLGMHYDARDDFDVPVIPQDHPLRRYVLYRHRAEPTRAPGQAARKERSEATS
ncbi:MAG TPA: GNAT family N-acetyltransferase [Candidatus Acidoferrales bacterium]|nr:GNAT family N-acetyltransferase [Candidatus Acidoferrales bacterium]